MDSQKFCLKWDGFQSSVTSLFDHLRQDEELVDITLCCDGQQVKAHRMMLSACSPYFRDLLKNNPCQQMVFFLKDTAAADLHAIIEFMYKGCVNVSQSQLASFIKTAEMLQIRGLSGDDDKPCSPVSGRPAGTATAPPVSPRQHRAQRTATPPPPPPKRRRMSGSDPPPPPLPPPPPPPPQQAPPPAPSGVTAAPTDAVSTTASSALSSQRRADSPGATSAGSSNQSMPSPAPPPQQQQQSQQPASSAATSSQQQAFSHQPPLEQFKVEKTEVDLTEEEDDDASLDATLGYVEDYEGQYVEPGMAAVGPHGELLAADVAAMAGLAGPSQRLGEDGSAQGLEHPCETCGRSFQSAASLYNHKKQHTGRTHCPLCQVVYSTVPTLRRHLLTRHRKTPDEVYQLVPCEIRFRRAGM